MEKQTVIALIATRSVPLAAGLEALLNAIPQIDEVITTRNFETAIRQIKTRKPRIMLLDYVLIGTEPEVSLEKINLVSPETQRVLLVDDVQEVKLVPHYAESILIKGISPSSIAASLINLLVTKGEENERSSSVN
jgi:DNA-binding NarL/FixJ family response regulator